MHARGSVIIVGLNYAPEPSGIAPYTAALARGLSRRGWRVRVITTHPHYPQWRLPLGSAWRSTESEDGVSVTRLRHYVPRHPRGVVRLLSELSFGLRAAFTPWGAPDAVVVVSPGLFASAIALLRSRLTAPRRPVLTWIQDLYSLGVVETEQGNASVARVLRIVERGMVRRSAAVAVIHERFRSYVVKELGGGGRVVKVIRNWTHIEKAPAVDRAAVRASHGWESSETVVVHSGAMGVKQGLSNVVEAARHAAAQGLQMRFVMIGGGSEKAELERHQRELDNFEVWDTLPEPAFQAVLQAADVLLVNERPGVAGMAVPSKLTSYFNAGRPVLAATDAGSVTESEILRSGGGVVVPAGDPAELISAAVGLSLDAERAASLGAAGLEFRRKVLDEEAALDAFSAMILEMRHGEVREARRHQPPTNESSDQ